MGPSDSVLAAHAETAPTDALHLSLLGGAKRDRAATRRASPRVPPSPRRLSPAIAQPCRGGAQARHDTTYLAGLHAMGLLEREMLSCEALVALAERRKAGCHRGCLRGSASVRDPRGLGRAIAPGQAYSSIIRISYGRAPMWSQPPGARRTVLTLPSCP